MYNSKLIKIYQSLNASEKTLFKKWVHSPAHNRHEDVIKLFDYITSRRKLTIRNLDKRKLFTAIDLSSEYDDLRLRHIMSLGVDLLEEFVCFIMNNKSESKNEKQLVRYYRSHKMDHLAAQHLKKASMALEKASIKNSAYYVECYELEQEIFEQTGEEERVRTINLQAMLDAYSNAFVIETLRNACTALTHQNLNKKNSFQIPFLEPILKAVEAGTYKDIIAVAFYYNSYMALTYPEEERHYKALKQLLLKYPKALKATEIKNIYVIALNFCIKQLNTGEEAYVGEVFDMFKYGLKHNVLIKNSILSRFTFKNIVTAALRLNEIDWVSNFILEYQPYLEAKYQQNYAHYANAKLHYAKGDYAQTLVLLHQVEYEDLFLNLDAKMMLLKIYYEEESVDALESLLSSFYVYLQRKEIMGYHQDNYKNIIKFTRKLLSMRPRDKAAQQKLTDQIETTKPLTERIWLLQQVQKK